MPFLMEFYLLLSWLIWFLVLVIQINLAFFFMMAIFIFVELYTMTFFLLHITCSYLKEVYL